MLQRREGVPAERWHGLAAALLSRDSQSNFPTYTTGENGSVSSHGGFAPLRRFPYRSGRRRSRGEVRSFDLLNVLGTLGSQTPGQGSCRSSQRVIDWQRESIRRSPAALMAIYIQIALRLVLRRRVPFQIA